MRGTKSKSVFGDEFVWCAVIELDSSIFTLKKTVFFQCNDADSKINDLYKIPASANLQKITAQKKALQTYQASLARKTAKHIAWQLAHQIVQDFGAYLTHKELVEAGNDQIDFKIIKDGEVNV